MFSLLHKINLEEANPRKRVSAEALPLCTNRPLFHRFIFSFLENKILLLGTGVRFIKLALKLIASRIFFREASPALVAPRACSQEGWTELLNPCVSGGLWGSQPVMGPESAFSLPQPPPLRALPHSLKPLGPAALLPAVTGGRANHTC